MLVLERQQRTGDEDEIRPAPRHCAHSGQSARTLSPIERANELEDRRDEGTPHPFELRNEKSSAIWSAIPHGSDGASWGTTMVFNSLIFVVFFSVVLFLHALPFPWRVKSGGTIGTRGGADRSSSDLCQVSLASLDARSHPLAQVSTKFQRIGVALGGHQLAWRLLTR